MPEKEYQRLTLARSRSAFAFAFMSRSSLWLGKDHLLCVDSSGYTETYKRFYFRDIQAISIQRTDAHHWWSGILGFPAFVFFIITIATAPKTPMAQWSGGQVAGGIILCSITGFFIMLFLMNLLFGPACKCFLRTAVQVEELPSLNRVRRAHKALARLHPLIVAVQGELNLNEISSRMQAIVRSLADTTTPVNAVSSPSIADRSQVPPVIS